MTTRTATQTRRLPVLAAALRLDRLGAADLRGALDGRDAGRRRG